MSQPLPFFFIGKTLTADRIDSYVTQKHGLISQSIGKDDTKSIWYSREHIEKLLEEIDYAGGDGLLVSFGTYETGHEFAGQTCLVMNLTKEITGVANKSHQVIELEDEDDYEERSALPRDIILFPGDDPLAPAHRDFNYGSPCPPRCDTFFQP